MCETQRMCLPLKCFSDELAANILEHDYNSGSVHKCRLRSLRRIPLSRKGGVLAHNSRHEGILGYSGALDFRLRGRSRRFRHVLHHAGAALHHRGNSPTDVSFLSFRNRTMIRSVRGIFIAPRGISIFSRIVLFSERSEFFANFWRFFTHTNS